jgi:UDP-N-acetyl-D-glucosamine dehydrogenase
VQNALNDAGKAVKGSRVHILGVAYKRDIDDVRESPALDVMHLLQRRGAEITYSDPYVPMVRIDGKEIFASEMAGALPVSDCVVIITDHTGINYQEVLRDSRLVVDTRNALRGTTSKKLIRL